MARMIILMIGLFLTSLTAYSQENNFTAKESISELVVQIEKQKSLMLNYTITKTNIRLANKLSRISKDTDLIALLESRNPTVFCIAYLILAKRNNSSVHNYYQKYTEMNETEFIEWNRIINRNDRQHKSDVLLLYTTGNFIKDVNDAKFIKQIR
jgi:hypothetical protein